MAKATVQSTWRIPACFIRSVEAVDESP